MHPRNNPLLLAAALFCFQIQAAYSQESPVQLTEREEKGGGKKYYQYFDINQFEQTTLLKAGFFLEAPASAISIDGLSFAVEQKFFPSLSGEVSWFTDYQDRPSLAFRTRYYPNKRKRSEAKNDWVNNFTGNYVSAGYIRSFQYQEDLVGRVIGDTRVENNHTYALSFGRQQKLGKWGYFDTRLAMKYFQDFKTLFIGFDLNAGWAYGPTAARKEWTEEPDKHALLQGTFFNGRNTLSIENPYLQIGDLGQAGGLTFSGEFKIMDYFSVVSNLSLWHNRFSFIQWLNNQWQKAGVERYGLTVSAELRRYIGVKHRLQKGKPVRAFTGSYLGLRLQNLFYASEVKATEGEPRLGSFRPGTLVSPTVGAHYGWQQRLGKRIFADLNIGLGYDTYLRNLDLVGHTRMGVLLRK